MARSNSGGRLTPFDAKSLCGGETAHDDDGWFFAKSQAFDAFTTPKNTGLGPPASGSRRVCKMMIWAVPWRLLTLLAMMAMRVGASAHLFVVIGSSKHSGTPTRQPDIEVPYLVAPVIALHIRFEP
ncbi:hypothetical protein CTA1_11018 [Colletotrichum tanaceti]|uniref:Uncharacterized protein n=1 Tax=Colletotrichum tanaceti TaxID=1306861 RepID=A0A4U6WZB9_9PEZI|nr:hypothetical protein CTA1_11018 [Colletotrichum tanaceti]